MNEETNNLLVVDWDYFFPEKGSRPGYHDEWMLWDWGHSEHWGGQLQDAMWVTRAAGFMHNDIELPRMNEEWKTFWNRFDIDPDASLFYADSNVHAWAASGPGTDAVWLYDAHHDSGYHGAESIERIEREQRIECEDWMIAYEQSGAELHVRYPRWKKWAFECEPEPAIEVDRQVDTYQAINPVRFDTVFVCRSGSWVPSWCDDDFESFIFAAPAAEVVELAPCEPRSFSMDDVTKLIDAREKVWELTHGAQS